MGLGNLNGMYNGVQRLNQAQMDRWNIVAALNHPPLDEEVEIVLSRVPELDNPTGRRTVASMVAVAQLTREGFRIGDLSTLMSPRTVITWAENVGIFGELGEAFRLSFLNKCDESEKVLVKEYFQRCFDLILEPQEELASTTGRPFRSSSAALV